MFEIFFSYTFQVVALGTLLLGLAAGAVGTVSLLKGQSLIGDAIGHSAFPGVVLAFMLFLTREPVLLVLGAAFTGALAFGLIGTLERSSKLNVDTILAVVLSSFFGLGMVLKSYTQGNPAYSTASQSGLQNYIFGQAAYIGRADVIMIAVVAFVSLALLVLFIKEIEVYVFDPIFSQAGGFAPARVNLVVIVMTLSLIAVGLKAIGAILIASMLIAPAVCALQWSDKFRHVLVIAAVVGGVSAVLGAAISSVAKGFSTGPSIVLVMSAFALVSLLAGPHGVIATAVRRRRQRAEMHAAARAAAQGGEQA